MSSLFKIYNMEQKKVSFAVAKAIKKAGYPQGKTKLCYIIRNWNNYNPMGTIVNIGDFPAHGWQLNYYFADIPTYLEVWLWLWRENKTVIMIDLQHRNSWAKAFIWQPSSNTGRSFECIDPEEAIEEAIKYIVENNLIK